jgi:hypothetical protein
VPGFGERDAAADRTPGGYADWVADVIGSFLLCPSGGSNAPPGLLAHPKEHAVSVDYVGLDSRRDGRSGLPDLQELQAWSAGVGLIG